MTRLPLRRVLTRRFFSWIVILIVLANAALAVPSMRYGAAFALLWLLPGLAWAGLLSGWTSRLATDHLIVGFGLGVGSVSLLTLLLHYIPGPLSFALMLVAVDGLLLALTIPAFRVDTPIRLIGSSSLSWSPAWLVVPLAALFRLLHLGYSEFQGDEATIMLRAASGLLGDGSQLFYHQKGPLEVLVPTATWALSGVIKEWQARLPFALAGIVGVAAMCVLGRRWFGERAGVVAALLLAINGYFIGFGRIVQYQSLVLLMTSLGLLALSHWSEGGPFGWLAAGSALLAAGLLAHYDAALVLPAALYLVARRVRPLSLGCRDDLTPLREVLGAVALGLAVLIPFYVPFVLHPNFGKTFSYLSGARLGTGRLLYNNLLSSLSLATFYNSTYYLVLLAGAVVLASFLPFQGWGLLIPAGWFLLALLLPGSWTAPVLTALFVLVLLVSDSPQARTAWLWFGVPFLFYYFLVWDPRTHVLNAFPGAVLLAGLVVERFGPRLSLSGRRLLGGFLLTACLILSGYPYLMFVRHDPEIKRTWPDHRPGLYWRPALETPRYGYFGFPYRAGWKAVGALIQTGRIEGVYASNEEQAVTDWYTRGAERTYCDDPKWYLMAKDVQDEIPIPEDEVGDDHTLWGSVQVAGRSKLRIYRREPVSVAPASYDLQAYARSFDAHSSPAAVLSERLSKYMPADYTLGQRIRLIGYRLDEAHAYPGGSVKLVLYWEALEPLTVNYQVFTHLYDGMLWGQHDGAPACAMRPTTSWEPGRIVRDEHRIPIDPQAPSGDLPLLVGMYSLQSEKRLAVDQPDADGTVDAIHLTTIQVSREGTP